MRQSIHALYPFPILRSRVFLSSYPKIIGLITPKLRTVSYRADLALIPLERGCHAPDPFSGTRHPVPVEDTPRTRLVHDMRRPRKIFTSSQPDDAAFNELSYLRKRASYPTTQAYKAKGSIGRVNTNSIIYISSVRYRPQKETTTCCLTYTLTNIKIPDQHQKLSPL